ncbi:hypothetical protein ACLEEK_01650 [Lonsdalea quercina]|uniref:hypothetical protein n=1 Tax=Lonsdalea quercina TaxID=71657 RepID=UPI003974C02D
MIEITFKPLPLIYILLWGATFIKQRESLIKVIYLNVKWLKYSSSTDKEEHYFGVIENDIIER